MPNCLFEPALPTTPVDVKLKQVRPLTLTPNSRFPPHGHACVWIGFHYRHSGIAGVRLGREVAHWTLQRYLGPVHGHDEEDSDGG
jgi:hypothetical protein